MGLSSNSGQPNANSGEQDEAKKVGGVLFVASGDAPIAIKLAEQVLDEVALFVNVTVDLSLHQSVRFRRNHGFHFFRFNCGEVRVRVVGLVGDEVFPLRLLDELGRFSAVVDVPRREVDVERITEPVNESVDLGRKTSARASNTSILGPPFPPAESWCAFTYEPSAMFDS